MKEKNTTSINSKNGSCPDSPSDIFLEFNFADVPLLVHPFVVA